MEHLHYWFSFVCGQSNCWHLAGQALPVCQRCIGLYAGSACAVVCWLFLRPRPSVPVLWTHGLFLLVMIPFGYHLVPQNGTVRTITGWLFAFGLVYYMSAFVSSSFTTARISIVAGVAHCAAPKGAPAEQLSYGNCRVRAELYFGCVVVGSLVLLAGLYLGGSWTARSLSLLAAAGFLALAMLSATALLMLARDAVRRFSRA